MKGRGVLLMDANVLIDFCDVDVSYLSVISNHLGKVHVPRSVIAEEVPQLHDVDLDELGVVAVEPSLEIAMRAAQRRAGLSFNDHLCLLLAIESGWTCITNDTRLRRECAKEGVAILWGLETVALLVEAAALSVVDGAELGTAIQQANPKFIAPAVLAKFMARIGAKVPAKPRRPR